MSAFISFPQTIFCPAHGTLIFVHTVSCFHHPSIVSHKDQRSEIPDHVRHSRAHAQIDVQAGALAVANGEYGIAPFGAARTVGQIAGSPALGIGTGKLPAREGPLLPTGTGILGGVTSGVGKILGRVVGNAVGTAALASEVTPAAIDVRALSTDTTAGKLPVPFPSGPTHPLTTPS